MVYIDAFVCCLSHLDGHNGRERSVKEKQKSKCFELYNDRFCKDYYVNLLAQMAKNTNDLINFKINYRSL